MAIDPVGLLVIRGWVEAGSERPLRAELRITCDTRHGFERELSLSEPEAIEAAVGAWLKDILARSG